MTRPHESQFSIEILDIHWLNGTEEAEDLCAHGHVRVVIGDEAVSTFASGDWSLSLGALHLMRTLSVDYRPNQFGAQLLSCCGHALFAIDDGNSVESCGCFNGIDWQVAHTAERRQLTLTTSSGGAHVVALDVYREQVLGFADRVEAFYSSSAPKHLPDEAGLRDGYLAFWNEWRRRRIGAVVIGAV